MGSTPDPPDPPDYGPIAEVNRETAERSFKLAEKQFAWAKETWKSDKKLTDKVASVFLKTMDDTAKNAQADRARYEKVYQPLEDKLVAESKNYATQDRKDKEIGRATAAVAQQFEGARDAAQRQLESFGVNPSATRFAALDLGVRTSQAAAAAAAANQASEAVDNTGRALRSEAINIGRGYPGQVAGAYGTSGAAGTGVVGNQATTTSTGQAGMGTAPQYMGAAQNAVNSWGNTLNMGYQNQMAQWNAQQSQSSGLGGVFGMGAGIGLKLLGLEGGGAIPVEASPSRGAMPDDVPVAAEAGEFMMPREAVEWYGQKHFYNLVEKAQKEKQALPVGRPAQTPS